MRQIRDREQQFALLRIQRIGITADLVDAVADAAHLGLDGAGVLTLLLRHADLLADAVAVALQLLPLRFHRTTMLIDREHLVHHRHRELAATRGEALLHMIGLFADESDVEHKARIVAEESRLSSRAGIAEPARILPMPVLAHGVPLHRVVISEIIFALGEIFIRRSHADKVIERGFKIHRKWGARDRRLFAESVYDIVRWWRWLWHLAGLPDDLCLKTEAVDEARLWRVWAAYWIDRHQEVPPFPETLMVTAANVRERKEATVAPAIRAALPDWLYDLGSSELGGAWPAMVEALNQTAPVDLRVNTLKTTLRDLQHEFHQLGIEAKPVQGIADALRLRERKNLFTTALFKDGMFELQDAASQRIAPFLQAEPGMRVVDACAGAGGKTLHLAALMQNKGRIISLDIHQWKLDELKRRSRRNGAGIIETRLIEDTRTIKRLARSADRVLLDVPCSGLGVLRRNPDTKWKLSVEELARLRDVQREILESHSRMVKPGGKLVYATCSILPEENEKQVRAFMEKNSDAWTLEEEMSLRPGDDDGDGFYAARLVRKAGAAEEKEPAPDEP